MAVTVVVIVGMASHFLQEMEMGEKPKKAPEQTAMVKMGMLGTLTIFTTVIFTICITTVLITIHNPRGGVHALPAQHLGCDAFPEVTLLHFSSPTLLEQFDNFRDRSIFAIKTYSRLTWVIGQAGIIEVTQKSKKRAINCSEA